MSKIKNCFIFTIAALIILPFIASAQNPANPEPKKPEVKKTAKIQADKEAEKTKILFGINPQELNLGTISIDKTGSEGIFVFKNNGRGVIKWSTDGPEGWENVEKQKLSGMVKNVSDGLSVAISLLSKDASKVEARQKYNYVEMKLESGAGKITCRKELPAGMHKETIKLISSDGPKVIVVTFIIGYTQNSPFINLYPSRLDMGVVGPDKNVSKKIIATNSGREILTWSVAAQKHQPEEKPFNLGRYVSFANEEVKGSGVYAVPAHFKDTFEITGKWSEQDGYPAGAEGENIIKFNFIGTGIILYLLNPHEEANMIVSLDKRLIDNKELFEQEEKRGELLIAKDLVYGPHVLTVMSKNSRLGFEGVKILGEPMLYFPEGSIKIMPNSGAITRQTNYINVSLNALQMQPGYYLNKIKFNTNGGEEVVEIYAEVVPDNLAKVIDVYRYYNGTDYMFTANPQAESGKLIQNRYAKEGIAFRLFIPDTPGTVSFYRWYNPQTKLHFCHYDQTGGGKNLQGYIFEGPIGNIATSKLTNTRELYRWYNPRTGGYFYSTDAQGGRINKKIYRFDGIAGYVK